MWEEEAEREESKDAEKVIILSENAPQPESKSTNKRHSISAGKSKAVNESKPDTHLRIGSALMGIFDRSRNELQKEASLEKISKMEEGASVVK